MLVLNKSLDDSELSIHIVTNPDKCKGRFRGIKPETIDYFISDNEGKIYCMLQTKLRNFLLPGSLNVFKYNTKVIKTFIWHKLHRDEL